MAKKSNSDLRNQNKPKIIKIMEEQGLNEGEAEYILRKQKRKKGVKYE